jgi:hypothetical protein
MKTDSVRILAIIAAAIALMWLLYYYYHNNNNNPSVSSHMTRGNAREHFSDYVSAGEFKSKPTKAATTPRKGRPHPNPDTSPIEHFKYEPYPVEPMGNEIHLPPPNGMGFSQKYGKEVVKSPFPQDRISPEDLLPKDAANTKWAQANPAGQGDVKDVNLLNAGFHLGVDTQGQSLRNASHDLRSEPSNPRYKVSIWNNATIEGDLNRRPLE